MVDYICGLYSRNYNRRKFWVGYAESAVAIREDVDETIRNEILKTSEFIIPILFEKPGRKKLGCTEIQIPGTCLNGCHEKNQNIYNEKCTCTWMYCKVYKEIL